MSETTRHGTRKPLKISINGVKETPVPLKMGDADAFQQRFSDVTTWKGMVDSLFLQALKDTYGVRILELAKDDHD